MGILRRREKPKTYHHPSIVQPSSGIVGNIASSMITGVGLGVGSEVGHQVARKIMSETDTKKGCELEKDNFRRCMDNTGNEFKMCEDFFNALKNCK
jgi:hypothetical protein